MASLNKCMFIGNLCADVELKYTPSNRPVANMRIACNEVWKDRDGKKQERVEYISITVWGDQAEHCSKYLSKGRSVFVEGRFHTETYEKNGEKRYATKITADKVVFLGGGGNGGARDNYAGQDGKRGGGGGFGGGGGSEPAPTGAPGAPLGDDDIPF